MVDTLAYAEPLEACIAEMRLQMARPENIAKSSWSESTIGSLATSVYRNLDALTDAVASGDRKAAIRRAANVANHAWMLADLHSTPPAEAMQPEPTKTVEGQLLEALVTVRDAVNLVIASRS